MLEFMENKVVVVKRYSSVLGKYNRPNKTPEEIAKYPCHTADTSSNTAQKQPQKENTTELTLYTIEDADIKMGDVLYIYEIDEYDNPILSTEYKALADRPYHKRTHLAVPLLSVEEV